jgi:uncharacterized membrane protein YfcA
MPETNRAARRQTSRKGIAAFVAGLVLGTAAGLIGVGGGEFRIPVLLHLLNLKVKTAAGVNLIVGLFTVILSFFRRWGQQPFASEDVTLASVLVVASVIGSAVGAQEAHRLPSQPLKKIVLAYLLIVGIWMVIEAFLHAEFVLFQPHGWLR